MAHYVYCIYLMCFTDGPTGVWCVCACACNNAEEANIMGRRLLGHLSLKVCERTGHGLKFYLCKVNKFFLFHHGDLAPFFLFLSRAFSDREPCCSVTKAGGLSIYIQIIGDNVHLYKSTKKKIFVMQILSERYDFKHKPPLKVTLNLKNVMQILCKTIKSFHTISNSKISGVHFK